LSRMGGEGKGDGGKERFSSHSMLSDAKGRVIGPLAIPKEKTFYCRNFMPPVPGERKRERNDPPYHN